LIESISRKYLLHYIELSSDRKANIWLGENKAFEGVSPFMQKRQKPKAKAKAKPRAKHEHV
jgi:hypothetical protein